MTTIYVNFAAPPAGDGLSWATAYQTLQPALVDAGTNPGSQIWIAQGTYSPGGLAGSVYNVPNNTSIYGGFVGTEATIGQRNPNPALNPTYLDGANVNNSVMTSNGTVLLNRLNLKQAKNIMWSLTGIPNITVVDTNFTDMLTGLQAINTFANTTCSFTNVTFKNLSILVNFTASAVRFGGGVTGTITNTLFQNVTSRGAIVFFNSTGNLTLDTVEIANCSSVGGLGGIDFNSIVSTSAITINNCKLHDISTPTGNSPLTMLDVPKNVTITNTQIYNNTSASAAIFLFYGISVNYPTPTVVIDNCYIHDNVSSDSGSGIALDGFGSGTATLTISNTEISNNQVNGNVPPDDPNFFIGSVGGGVLLHHYTSFDTAVFNVAINNCNIHDNYASYYGGGVYYYGVNTTGSDVITITGTTINNNSADISGGGVGFKKVSSKSATLTLTNCVVNGNVTEGNGGAFEIQNDFKPASPNQITIQNTQIKDNVADQLGGAIHINNGAVFTPGTSTLNLTNVTVDNNSSRFNSGGGVAASNYNAIISGSTFSNNKSSISGGAWYAVGNNTTDFNTTIFDRNSAYTDGGATAFEVLGSELSTFQMNNMTFSKNKAQGGYGGGVSAFSVLPLKVTGTIANSQFLQNKAVNGAALSVLESNVQINTTETSQNSAIVQGGGYYAANSTLSVNNNHVHNNTSLSKGGALAAVNTTLTLNGGCHIHNNNGLSPGGVFIQAGTSTVATNNVHNNSGFEIGWTSTAVIGGQNTQPTIKTYLTTNNTVSAFDIGQVV